MRKSSAKQQELEFSDWGSTAGSEQQDVAGGLSDEAGASGVTEPGSIAFQGFGVSDSLYAVTSKRAGRLNAASISKEEVDELLRERQKLLDKKFDETITRAEAIRLEYVRWSLDRIEDAMHGETLDALESVIAQYEVFQQDLENLERDLSRHKKGTRRDR